MQQTPYLNDLKYIVESICIEPDSKLIFKGKSYESHYNLEGNDEIRLFQNLTNLIYSSCYTRSRKEERRNNTDPEKDNSFLSALRMANVSTELYNCGWSVEEIEETGNILVRKGGNKRYTFAGDFIREHLGQGPLQRGEIVNIRVLPEYFGEGDVSNVFYFVFGETLLDNNNSAIVRVYFNVSPEGAIKLVGLISTKLNHFNIPFQFKCLNRTELYTRCDSAVLYIDKRYFGITGDMLSDGYDEFRTWLNPDVPMFTRKLAPGIGFAENPFSPTESFGTLRCKIIAQGILDAWNEKKTKEVWMDFILKNIRKNYLLLEAFYLNPNSKYPYKFPQFKI